MYGVGCSEKEAFIIIIISPMRRRGVYGVCGGEEGADVLGDPHRRLHPRAVSSNLKKSFFKIKLKLSHQAGFLQFYQICIACCCDCQDIALLCTRMDFHFSVEIFL